MLLAQSSSTGRLKPQIPKPHVQEELYAIKLPVGAYSWAEMRVQVANTMFVFAVVWPVRLMPSLYIPPAAERFSQHPPPYSSGGPDRGCSQIYWRGDRAPATPSGIYGQGV